MSSACMEKLRGGRLQLYESNFRKLPEHWKKFVSYFRKLPGSCEKLESYSREAPKLPELVVVS